MGWLTWSFQLLCLQLVVLNSVSCANLCSHDQSSALLHFKQLFSFSCYGLPSLVCDKFGTPPYPKMEHWKEDSDCCLWDGVTCDGVTGHAIGLDLTCSCLLGSIPSNSSLFLLTHLQNLNLAFNDFNLSSIPSDFGRLKSLTHLNLSSSWFSGPIPLEISHLSKLVSLDLSVLIEPSLLYRLSSMGPISIFFGYLTLKTSVLKGLVQNMTALEKFVPRGVNMSTIDPAYLTNLSSSLTLLDLQSCNLQGSSPESILHLPNLRTLDLSVNDHLTVTFPVVNWSSPLRYLDVSFTQSYRKFPYSIENLNSLVHLDLGYCGFLGSIPTSIGNLTQLSYLSLAHNNLSGHIPSFLSNLMHLNSLKLHENEFDGEIPDVFFNLTQISHLELSWNRLSGPIPSSIGNGLQNLAYFDLHNNLLNGTIPSGLFNLQLLVYMDLSNNQLTGRIAEFQKTSLQRIYLNNNRLHGPIPNSISELENLTHLRLSSNKLSGTIELYMFAKLKNLLLLDLSYNTLSVSTSIKINSSFLPQLSELDLSSCNIKEFPEVLSNVGHLEFLDLSANKIHGEIPNWLFNLSLLYTLNISHNFLRRIDRLPAPPPLLMFFSASHNNLTGMMPSSFCNSTSIRYLDLSNNGLNGMIPQCLGNFTSLMVLDLKSNNFNGRMLQTFVKGSQLTTLNLNGNQLEGPLPHSLVNCGKLEVLDLGNNNINDTFPHWIAILRELQVLVLRSNRFYGPLGNSEKRLSFFKLRILDLSDNRFSGYLQTGFFKTFQAMMGGKNISAEMKYMGDRYYRDSVIITMKGVEIEMQRILTIFSTMDLSKNKFQGQIPDVVGKLKSLKVLNFSHNNLIGYIPMSLKNLTELESLDLSSNRLEGEISIELISLTSLAVLNLSYNQLVGPIPSGNQFNTFENNSYIGNLGLCGLPLSKGCSSEEAPEPESPKFKDEQDNLARFDWKIILMGYGSGLVIGVSMGYIMFSTAKPWWFVSMVERKVLKLTGRRRRGRRRN